MQKIRVLEQKKQRAVAWWLVAGVLMIIIQVLLGGVTRLTDSGLSITQWRPLLGVIPPLNEEQWNKAFDGYKQIGQFKMLNSDFQLSDFKAIFFWEWLHRSWGILISVVFAIGFAFFFLKNYFDKKMIKPFIILFLLGGIQGSIGWIMVLSGLNDTHLYVDHIKLALHFISAMILACYTLWFALKLLIPEERRIADNKLFLSSFVLIIVVFLQLTYGAFMAGLKAALVAPTWPTINGMWLPEGMTNNSFVSDKINIHFIHRGMAYLLLLLLIGWFTMAIKSVGKNPLSILKKTSWWPMLSIVVQVLLGITVLMTAHYIVPGKFGTFEIFAELHQLVAMFLLMSLIINLYVVGKKS